MQFVFANKAFRQQIIEGMLCLGKYIVFEYYWRRSAAIAVLIQDSLKKNLFKY